RPLSSTTLPYTTLFRSLLGNVDVQREIELQRDHRAAERARRGHLLEARHLSELPLEQRGDRARHHVGTGAGVEGRDLNRRVVHRSEEHTSELQSPDQLV